MKKRNIERENFKKNAMMEVCTAVKTEVGGVGARVQNTKNISKERSEVIEQVLSDFAVLLLTKRRSYVCRLKKGATLSSHRL